MTQATLGIGSKLAYETVPGASPLAFTEVGEVLDIALPHTRAFEDVTNQDSGQNHEYIAALLDAEVVEMEANYLPQSSAQADIYAMFLAGTARKWRVRETTTSPEVTWTFDAIVASFSPQLPVQTAKRLQFSLRRTGETVRT